MNHLDYISAFCTEQGIRQFDLSLFLISNFNISTNKTCQEKK